MLTYLEYNIERNHLLCSDTFNENQPPTDDPSYISALGAIVYKAMSAADEDAIWLMQASLIPPFSVLTPE